MLFSSIPFLYCFLPATILLYLIAPKKAKNTVLLLASLVFYAWGEKKLVLLFALTILLGWIFGFLIAQTRGTVWSKIFLAVSVLTDLGLLCYFKYADFLIANINGIFRTDLPLLRIALPIGISFYTFQILSYTIDVYRGSVPTQKSLIDFAAYVSLFPQLIAGPIVRYADVAQQLGSREHSLEGVAAGVSRFLIGLGKKVLIANVVGEVCTQFRQSGDVSVLFYWLYAVCFMLQIYFDFSGYSDMAIGLGKMFGFTFMENFNYPYMADSITDFWRRWHISLGSWFRDYVYIPLGGNRKGPARLLLNIFIVWALTGLWHGAAWNFILWGLFYAVLLTVEKFGLLKILQKHRIAAHIYVLLAVLLGFVLFNADSLAQTAGDIAGLFAFGRLPLFSTEALYCLRSYGVVILLGIVGSTPLAKTVVRRISAKPAGEKVVLFLEPVLMAALLLVVTAYLVDGSFNPFLYFRF